MPEERVKLEKKRNIVDWRACEADYRTGTLSNRQLAEIYKCTEAAIRDRARRYNWSKDLTEAVRKETNARLLRTELRTRNALEDSEIVERSADLRVEVVRSHRRDISSLSALAIRLRQKAEGLIETVADLKDLDNATSVIESLARTASRLIPLERQAFNLDSDDSDKSKERPVDLSDLTREQRAKFRAVLTDINKEPNTGV